MVWQTPSLAFFRSRPTKIGTRELLMCLGLLLMLGFATRWLFHRKPQHSEGLTYLNRAYTSGRPWEARLTEFDYAPYIITRGEKTNSANPISLDQAKTILVLDNARNSSVASKHNLALFYLSQKDFGSATSLLREALTESDDARLHNDLGVAEFEQGKNEYNEDHPGDSFLLIARSVEEFKAAIKKDKTLQEAQFNLALCHQQMKLFLQAEKDWTQYLALDSSSRWAEEARKNLSLVQEEQKRVAESSSQSFPKFLEAVDRGDRDAAFSLLTESDRNGSSIAEKLIDNYLKNTLDERDGDAKAVFTTLDFAGQTELSRLNDHYISDVVIFLCSASTEKIKSIANARNLMHSANALYLSGDCKQAIDLYTKAQSIF